jgi:hypothetical protein
MALCAVGPSTGKLTLEYAQPPHFAQLEVFPAARRSASTLTAYLKAEPRLAAKADSVNQCLAEPFRELSRTPSVETSTRAVITAAMSNELPIFFGFVVGARGFEPPTPRSRTKRPRC